MTNTNGTITRRLTGKYYEAMLDAKTQEEYDRARALAHIQMSAFYRTLGHTDEVSTWRINAACCGCSTAEIQEAEEIGVADAEAEGEEVIGKCMRCGKEVPGLKEEEFCQECAAWEAQEAEYHTRVHINEEIARRTSYGVRTVEVWIKGYVLTWSNGSQKWYRSRVQSQVGERLQLDANEIYVPYKAKWIDHVIDTLDPLPLYANSTEAKMRAL